MSLIPDNGLCDLCGESMHGFTGRLRDPKVIIVCAACADAMGSPEGLLAAANRLAIGRGEEPRDVIEALTRGITT